MSDLYITDISLPDEDDEFQFFLNQKRTSYNGTYPFKIFPHKRLEKISFAPITIFYGNNGSGKSTLLNIIGEKFGVLRHSEFSSSGFFDSYLELCHINAVKTEAPSQFLSSDDVFDYVMNMRYLNNDIDDHRNQLIKGYAALKRNSQFQEARQLHGLENYDRWKEITDSYSKTESKFVKERLARNIDMFSNGETAFRYFTEHIENNAVYLLDEPENSLSVNLQKELTEFIEASARFYNCQFIIATHSPVVLSLKNAKIYNLDSTPVTITEWSNLPNVRAYFDFFEEHRNEFSKGSD